MAEIKITLETLYDILRNEKKREDLQKLEDTFFVDVVAYLREKQSMLTTKTADQGLFAAGEKEKLEYESRSIKRILKQIYELREKKIIDIALNKSRTGSDIIDTSSMLRVERDFYHYTLKTLDHYRRGILLQLFKAELPDVMDPVVLPSRKSEERPKEVSVKNEGTLGLLKEQEKSPAVGVQTSPSTIKLPSPDVSSLKKTSELSVKSQEQKPESTFRKFLHADDSGGAGNKEMIKVRFIHPVPSFIWKDMKEYGPFDVGELTKIFPEVADLLVRKGRAEKV